MSFFVPPAVCQTGRHVLRPARLLGQRPAERSWDEAVVSAVLGAEMERP